MEGSKTLFDKLTLNYIKTEMLGKEFENAYLECKEKAHPAQPLPDRQDESNFAKALSAFGNTSGGVLVFGLRARRKNDVDQIQEIVPISDIIRFESRLRELESRVVERPIAGVEYRSIKTMGKKGILAILIPQSAWLPHRSTRDWKFYIRAGGTFQPIDLNLVEDLFFRRRLRPKLELTIRAQDKHRITVLLANKGEASAKNPYLVLALPKEITTTGFEVDGNTRLSSFVFLNQYQGKNGRFWAYQRGTDLVIHPHSEVPLLSLRCANTTTTSPHGIEYHIYADDMPPNSGRLTVTV